MDRGRVGPARILVPVRSRRQAERTPDPPSEGVFSTLLTRALAVKLHCQPANSRRRAAMTHWTSFAGVSLVALSLAFPDPSWAQARSRGGSGGGSSGGSSSGGHVSRPGGGGSSGGGARSAPQGGGGSRATARPRSSAPPAGDGGPSSAGSQATVTRSAGGVGSTGNAR